RQCLRGAPSRLRQFGGCSHARAQFEPTEYEMEGTGKVGQGEVMNFIDGAYTQGTSGKTFRNISPVDGSLISEVHEAGKADVDAAVRAARKAVDGDWGRMPV